MLYALKVSFRVKLMVIESVFKLGPLKTSTKAASRTEIINVPQMLLWWRFLTDQVFTLLNAKSGIYKTP
jgi:hypothetical protein